MKTLGHAIAKFCASKFSSAFQTLAEVGEAIAEISSTDGSITSTIWDEMSAVVTQVIDGLVPFGLSLCVLFFIIALLELAMSERMTLEFFVKFLSKLVVGVCAVYFAKDIWQECVKLGNAFGELVGSLFSLTTAGQTAEEQMEELGLSADALTTLFTTYIDEKGANGWIGILMGTVSMVIPLGLAAIVLKIVAYMVGFSRILELCLRGCFLPVACALLSDDGWRGAGGRYIRKFIAICCQSAVLVAIGNVTSSMIMLACSGCFDGLKTHINGKSDVPFDPDTFLDSFLTANMIAFGVGIASVKLMFSSIGIVNDVFGG